ncbi:MAG: sugar transferase [Candidatus Binatia bacterium]|nr:sugar transferase [Candidatus Binatia bacterium]
MLKRATDTLVALVATAITMPLMVVVAALIFLEDRHSPFYVANRVGLRGRPFPLLKFRSMVVDADKSGVDSTGASDSRITRTGGMIRRFKLDELPQFLNVLVGQMSLVGPRPNVASEVALYTEEERRLLEVRPGITDLASIVFADEGDILDGADDPDLKYNQVIRPWKSRLGLLYVEHSSLALDAQIVLLTALALIGREQALAGVGQVLSSLGAAPELIRIAKRDDELRPFPPPGATEVVETRQLADAS